MIRPFAVSLLVCGLLGANAAPSSADTITFGNSALHPGGTITVGATVQLSGGVIDEVARSLPTLGFSITGLCGPGAIYGCLSITTGTFVGPNGMTPANDYVYSGTGSSISIIGGVKDINTNAQLIPNGTTLWTGLFDPGNSVTLAFDETCATQPTQCQGGLNGLLTGGTLNATLAALLGVSPNTTGGNDQNLFINFLIPPGVIAPAAGFPPTGTASINTNQLQLITPAAQTVVPEPGSLVLLGSGLVFAAHLVRRRRKV